jgi:hypothetical protein
MSLDDVVNAEKSAKRGGRGGAARGRGAGNRGKSLLSVVVFCCLIFSEPSCCCVISGADECLRARVLVCTHARTFWNLSA